LHANEPTFYYYNENPVKDYSILVGNFDEVVNQNNINNNNLNNSNSTIINTPPTPTSNNNTNNVNNNNNNNTDDNNDNDLINNTDVQASFQTILDELMANEHNTPTTPTTPTTINANNTNTNNNEVVPENQDELPTLSPQQFQEMLKSYVDLLDDRTIPDEDPRITGAICQWYTTLDIEMKPEMQISIERNRLIKVLSHLGSKVDEHIEDHNATGFFARAGLKVKRYCRNLFKRDTTVRLSLFVMIGLFVARSVQKRK